MATGTTKKSATLGLLNREGAQAPPDSTNGGGKTAVGLAEATASPATLDQPPGGEAAVVRLEQRTHLDTPRYRINLTNYGNGLAEIGWSFVPLNDPFKAGRGESDNRQANEDRAVRRARSRLRKKVLAAHADHLLTLTYRENVTDFEQASTDLNRFVRIVKARQPGWVYIAIAEQQKRGAWHWHLAVRGRQDVDVLRTAWRHCVGQGNIDVRPPKGEGQYRLLALVKYLGKYLAKGFGDGNRDLNARRFRSSLGIDIPIQCIPLPLGYSGNVQAFALETLRDSCGTVGFTWLNDDQFTGWACSWK